MAPIYKYVVITLLVLVLISLFSALFSMIKGDTSGKMVRALTWRIGLSVFLFTLLIIGQATGVIRSHGLY
jgi:hypothetical protein